MHPETNQAFVGATEALVNASDLKCLHCNTRVTIVNSLLRCEGSCGFGASVMLDLSDPERDEQFAAALDKMGDCMARAQQSMYADLIKYVTTAPLPPPPIAVESKSN